MLTGLQNLGLASWKPALLRLQFLLLFHQVGFDPLALQRLKWHGEAERWHKRSLATKPGAVEDDSNQC
jgi:hypothetical protein